MQKEANNQSSFVVTQNYQKEILQMKREDNQLEIQILRVHAIQKQQLIQGIFNMNQRQLCDYFLKYQPSPQANFKMSQLTKSQTLKLIKSQGKIFFGQVFKKKREGKGISINKQGKIFEGYYQNNQKNGKGIQIYGNGNLYLGQFLNNKKHGEGSFYWFNLSNKNTKDNNFVQYYRGQWWGGLPDGKGTHQKLNGDIFTGLLKNGLKHGQGIQFYNNGDYYKGNFINGMPQGYGQYVWRDQSSYKGDFKQGSRNGYGVWKSNKHNSQVYKGHFNMDKKSGHGVYKWQNDWYYKGKFQNDLRHGYGQLYDNKDRIIYKGYWQYGQQTQKSLFKQNQQEINNYGSVKNYKNTLQIQVTDFDKLSRRSLKLNNNQNYLQFPSSQYSKNITQHKKRPLSHRETINHKIQKQSSKKNINTNYISTKEQFSQGSTRKIAGTIFSNLFVPGYRISSKKK